jgi:hypothetical protein
LSEICFAVLLVRVMFVVCMQLCNLPGHGLIAGTYTGQQLIKSKTGKRFDSCCCHSGDPVFVQAPAVTFNTTVGSVQS